MAKANLKAVLSENTPAVHGLLSDLMGYTENILLQAAEAVGCIAVLLSDNIDNDKPMSEIQIAGLCSALTIISKWQIDQACSLSDRAEVASKELGVGL